MQKEEGRRQAGRLAGWHAGRLAGKQLADVKEERYEGNKQTAQDKHFTGIDIF